MFLFLGGGGGAFHFGALGCHQNAKATRLNHQTRGICSLYNSPLSSSAS